MTIRKSIEDLSKREDKLFSERDERELKINRLIGRELTASEFLQLRQLFGEVDKYEEAIERVQERMQELSELFA